MTDRSYAAKTAEAAVQPADLQAKAGAPQVPTTTQRQAEFRDSVAAAKANRTGLSDRLKAGVEALSGFSLDDVRVHRNSPRPAQLRALAFTQGSDIHVAPGQERHLPHEAWHVVQQKQGRVKATAQLKGVSLNDDPALEREADAMGALAGGWTKPIAPSAGEARTAARPVMQQVTDEQAALLKARLAKDGLPLESVSYTGGDLAETATVNGRRVYQWIKGHNHWRFKGNVKAEGTSQGSFFGRLTSGSLSMLATTALTLGPLPTSEEEEEWAQDLADAVIRFAPSKSMGGSRATAASMGEFYFNRAAYLSAADYVLADSPGFEWLHMRADSLGGGIDPANLYAGSSSANSHMAALEKAVGESSGKGVTIRTVVSASTDNGHHTSDNGAAVIKRVNWRRAQNKQKPFGDEELKHFLSQPSHKLKSLSYEILANGQPAWKQTIDPMLPGKFDQQVFDVLKGLATKSIFGEKPTGLMGQFNQASPKQTPPLKPITSSSTSPAMVTSGSSSSSAASVFSGSTSSSSSASLFATSSTTPTQSSHPSPTSHRMDMSKDVKD